MKKGKFFMGLATAALLCGGLVSCGEQPSNPTPNPDKPSTELTKVDATVWVSEVAGVKELTQEQIKDFNKTNGKFEINATVEGISEADAATQMITSVEDGADIYCFAQDQLARLQQAKALTKLGVKAAEEVRSLHDAGAIKSSTIGDDIFCYPLTSDNGIFMYYDKRVVKQEHLGSLEDILADCVAAGKKFSYPAESDAWYNSGFFFGAGCHSNWKVAEDGKITGVEDNFNSDAGVIAMKGLQKIVKSTAYVDSSKTSDFAAAVPSAVVVCGTWGSKEAKDALGENLGAAPLPSYKIGDKTYPIGSFIGNKLMGVKPQTDNVKAAALQKLALHLTGEKAQLDRYTKFGWGPSNVKAQATEEVKKDVLLAALREQGKNAVPQGQIHGKWWDVEKVLGTDAKKATNDAEIKAALKKYEDAINGFFSMSEDEKNAFSVIGSMNEDGWKNDIMMEQKPEGTYYTTEPILFKAGDEFKCRQGKNWDVAYGNGKDNFKVTEAGYFYVKLVVADGKGTVTLEKANPNYSYGVVGANNNWGNADADGNKKADDFLTKVSETEYLSEALTFKANDEIKVRQGQDWSVNWGAENKFNNSKNIKVTEAGKYQVKMTIVDLATNKVTIELVPVTE